MTQLLDGRLAPLTFAWAFIEAPLSGLSPMCLEWWRQIHGGVRSTEITGELSDLLLRLPPLTGLKRRALLVETKSDWTAYFSNEVSACDPVCVTSYICQIMK